MLTLTCCTATYVLYSNFIDKNISYRLETRNNKLHLLITVQALSFLHIRINNALLHTKEANWQIETGWGTSTRS